MVDLSIIIPHRDAATPLSRQIEALQSALIGVGTYEIVIIDDGSAQSEFQKLVALIHADESLRLRRISRSMGTSAAVSDGIAASRGETVVAVEAGDRYRAEQLPQLLAALSRGDLVYGRPRRRGLRKAWHRVVRIPRAVLMGLEVRDPHCLFWAARREAVEGIDLSPGMAQFLPYVVSGRGYRVVEVLVDYAGDRTTPDLSDAKPLDVVAGWWLLRRRKPWESMEVGPQAEQPQLKVTPAVASDGAKPAIVKRTVQRTGGEYEPPRRKAG